MKNKFKKLLEEEYSKRNTYEELNKDKPDPLIIAKEQSEDMAILTCALFSYGSAKQIVKFLNTLPFDLFDRTTNESHIRERLKGYKYRFQTEEDIIQWFLIIQKIRVLSKKILKENNFKNNTNYSKKSYLKEKFLEYYKQNNNIIESINKIIKFIYSLTDYRSKGFTFLIGSEIPTNSPLKRWNMFLRWMVRKDKLDLGLWQEISKSDLIIPLDTHLFNIGKQQGLIKSKSYNLKSAIEMTKSLKEFDEKDPLKYDFVIYRVGQEKLI